MGCFDLRPLLIIMLRERLSSLLASAEQRPLFIFLLQLSCMTVIQKARSVMLSFFFPLPFWKGGSVSVSQRLRYVDGEDSEDSDASGIHTSKGGFKFKQRAMA